MVNLNLDNDINNRSSIKSSIALSQLQSRSADSEGSPEEEVKEEPPVIIEELPTEP